MPRVETVLSWNMKCSSRSMASDEAIERRANLLREIISVYQPTILNLQESPNEATLKKIMGTRFGLVMNHGELACAFDIDSWSCDHEETSEKRILALGLSAVGAGGNLWLVNVHAPTLYNDSMDKADFVQTTVQNQLKGLRNGNERSEIIAGDFNTPPFSAWILRKNGMHANRHLPWAQSRPSGIERGLFNPTWRLFANHKEASGTFYNSKISDDGPWHAIDQILVTPDLGLSLELSIIDNVGGKKLRKKRGEGAPDKAIGSDHLPLLAKVQI